MATNKSNSTTPQTTGSTTAPKDGNSKYRIIAIAAVIILALLAANIFLLVGYNKRGSENLELSSKFEESEQLKAELETQYYDALSELEEMRGNNDELNALIDQQKEELEQQKNRIEKLLANQGSLDRARKEMKRLNAQVEQYLAEINQLKAENEELTVKNTQLSDENQTLNQDLTNQRDINQQLDSEKQTLLSEKDELSKEKSQLSETVTKASVIQLNTIEGYGLKKRKSGKAVKKKNVKNIDYLEVCFNTTANDITQQGAEFFYVRIVNPRGETMAIDELGSGVFTNKTTGEQMRYTKVREIDYDGGTSQYCVTWSPGQAFSQGSYDVEIYNKGYLAGSSKFELN